MIKTETTLRYMPEKLQAFKKYIEEYVCTYFITDEDCYTIVFYKELENHYIPYVLLLCRPTSNWVEIYVNTTYDDLSKKDAPVITTNLISNDMNKFIEAIRQCVKEENNA